MEQVKESINGATNGAVNGAKSASKEGTASSVPLQIGGKQIHTSTTFPVTSPHTNEVIHHASSAGVSEAKEAVAAAQAAFKSWKNTPPAQKRDIFLKASEILTRRAEELGKVMEAETGADPFFAGGFNVPLSADILKDVAGRLVTIAGFIPTPADPGTSGLVFNEPFGVILAIAPWNAPYILGIRSIAYAIAAGNTAVLKAPEHSPKCYRCIGSVFEEAGLPDGVLNVIQHRPEDAAAVTSALISHPLVMKVNFTGSTAVGRIIAEQAGKNLKPVLLELGGKAPAVILEDADLEMAAKACAMGAFLHGGQICMSTEKIIVHKKVATEFATHMRAAIKEKWSEHQTMVNAGGVKKTRSLVKDAVSKGASLLNGDLDAEEEGTTRMRPIMVSGVDKSMDLYHTESFGPTSTIMEFETDEEAVELANDHEYGLNAAVFSKDLRRALWFAKEIQSGSVHINSMTVHDETALPHGGVKSSGYGRFGATGLDEWVRSKTVTYKN